MSDTPTQPLGTGQAAPPPAPPQSKTRADGPNEHRGGVTFGILLVLAGVAVLVGRYVPGLNVLNAWPLIIVVLGGVRVFRRRDAHGIADGLTTVLIGGILLSNTLGRLSWQVWLSIFSLWPLLLISAGVAIVGKAISQSWLRVAAQAIIIGGLLYGALVMPAGSLVFPRYVRSIDQGPMAMFEDAVTRGSAEPTTTRGTATVRWGAAVVSVKGGRGVASVSGKAPRGAQPVLTHVTADGRTDVSVGVPGGGGAGPDGRLDLTLGRDVRWEELALQLGATTADVDLRDLEVAKVDLETGASDTTLVLGDKARAVSISITAGAARVTIRVPREASVTVRTSGPMSTSLPSGFSRVGGEPLSERWERRGSGPSGRIDILATGGIVDLSVETY